MEHAEHPEPVTHGEVPTQGERIEHEAAQIEHATNNRAIVEVLTAAENIILTSVAIVLIALAAMLLINGAALLENAVAAGHLLDHVLDILDTILLVAVVMEIVYTVTLSLRSHELSAEPFLVVGIIAAIRRILEITIKIGAPTVTAGEGGGAVGTTSPAATLVIRLVQNLFGSGGTGGATTPVTGGDVSSLLAELALLALIVIALAVATFLIRRSQGFVVKLPSHPESALNAGNHGHS